MTNDLTAAPTGAILPPPAPAPASAPSAGRRVVSLLSFIVGLVGIVLGAVPLMGLLLPAAAVILGLIGRSRELGAPRWMARAGLILGLVGFVLGALWFLAESFGLVLTSA